MASGGAAFSPADTAAVNFEALRAGIVQNRFQVLHRWTDNSWEAGFDVLVFPECVVQLGTSKVIAFPQSNVARFRVMHYPDAAAPGVRDSERFSELRIMSRVCSQAEVFEGGAMEHDIVLRWRYNMAQ